MWSYFTFKNITYNFRNGPLLTLPDAKSTHCNINSVHFRAWLLWNGLSQSVKHRESNIELKMNWKISTVLVFHVDEIINKVFIVFCWFLLAFAICKH